MSNIRSIVFIFRGLGGGKGATRGGEGGGWGGVWWGALGGMNMVGGVGT